MALFSQDDVVVLKAIAVVVPWDGMVTFFENDIDLLYAGDFGKGIRDFHQVGFRA